MGRCSKEDRILGEEAPDTLNKVFFSQLAHLFSHNQQSDSIEYKMYSIEYFYSSIEYLYRSIEFNSIILYQEHEIFSRFSFPTIRKKR
jgi:hypothetical protein